MQNFSVIKLKRKYWFDRNYQSFSSLD